MQSAAVFQRNESRGKGQFRVDRGNVLSGQDFANHKFGEWVKVRVTDCKTAK
ncbi:hypothetical protein EDF78_104174 [Rahnella sp. BIGb0236]|jgi:hypothetical protein|nr:hypothetical protein EDF78_104174 [Rahnella sp. BIGb0236]VTQ56589.1 Uncharacterised protein [Campylobacter jejuni]